jgi:flavin-dependent dehydrogenase
MYDVIIIGAGVTGSSAAKKLADNGRKVLIVERFKLPRNKSCSGILNYKPTPP